MTKVAYVQWQDGLLAGSAEWETIAEQVEGTKADILVTNEMPFGSWRPVDHEYDLESATEWVDENERSLEALSNLDVKAIISSRPRLYGDRLVNEAFSLENGQYKILHHKHYFPSELGWHEASWFGTDVDGFSVYEVGGLKIGVLLCTELMFNEKARNYGREGANLIVSPRASGTNMHYWEAACAMASVISGSYVISSNRVGKSAPHIPEFGGIGLAYAPGGIRMGNTDPEKPINIIDIEVALSDETKTQYPCYLKYL